MALTVGTWIGSPALAVMALLSPALAGQSQTFNPSDQDAKFQTFIHDERAVAIAAGIKPSVYDAATANIHRNQRVEDLNLNQPEFVRPVWLYLDSAVSNRRVSDGQQALSANLETLTSIEARYGVPKEVVVSIWGTRVILVTDTRRSTCSRRWRRWPMTGRAPITHGRNFSPHSRSCSKQHFDAATMTSSWAGAFGQTQFTPTTFLKHAVDGDGDGTIDLWHSNADALASAANVLADAGWQRGAPWGYEVRLPARFAYDQADIDTVKPIAEWRRLGVTKVSGATLPANQETGAVFLPSGARGPAFMVFDNSKSS
ncbi:MAG: lytic murein transglycosylase [Rhizomicrobium sp.]